MRAPSKIDIDQIGRRGVTLAQSDRGREVASVLFILALATVMLFPAVRGDWPIGHDHPVHIFRIWQLREQLLHHGTPWGWSHRWFVGYPQNVIYPIGTDLFVLGVQALSLGWLTLGKAYGLAFWLFYFLYGYATYFFVRRAVGSRIAALIAVVFLLTDPGSNDIGGWFWIVDVGVWTGALGMVPALIGTAQMAALFESPTPRRAATVALCFGLALLCHPLHLIYFALAIPLLCVSQYVSSERTPWPHSFLLLGVALAIGFLIASFWLVPYIAALPYAGELGARGSDLTKMGEDLAAGHMFDRMNFLSTAFGFIGAICLLRARRTLPLFMGLFIFVTMIVSSSSFASLFGASGTVWFQKHIIAPRILMLLKPFWYGAAGFLLVSSWQATQLTVSTREPRGAIGRDWIRHATIVVVVAAFVAPILIHSLGTFWKWEVRRPTIWHSERTDLKAREAFVAWTKNALDRQGEFFRIAHGFEPNDYDLADLATEVPYPFYEVGHTPTGHFKHDVWSSSPMAFRAANVRFALSHRPLARADLRLVKVFRQQVWLYEFLNWNPVPFEISGSGPVQLMEFSDERIILRADEGALGSLRLNVCYYPNWRATRDGAAVSLTPKALPGIERSAFIQVPLSPGTYRFEYQHGASGYVGTAMCIVGLIACASLAKWDRLSPWLREHFQSERPPAANEETTEQSEK